MELKEIEKLAKMCKRLGICSVVTEQVSLTLDLHFSLPSKNKPHKDSPAPTPENPLTEEEILYWSSGGMDEAIANEIVKE